ncbi:MAG: hypothetical protein ACTSWN_06085 [Promethearchaeota archaeon]
MSWKKYCCILMTIAIIGSWNFPFGLIIVFSLIMIWVIIKKKMRKNKNLEKPIDPRVIQQYIPWQSKNGEYYIHGNLRAIQDHRSGYQTSEPSSDPTLAADQAAASYGKGVPIPSLRIPSRIKPVVRPSKRRNLTKKEIDILLGLSG